MFEALIAALESSDVRLMTNPVILIDANAVQTAPRSALRSVLADVAEALADVVGPS